VRESWIHALIAVAKLVNLVYYSRQPSCRIEESLMHIVKSDQTRETSTPNATMRTFASPALAGASLAMWKVTMVPGQRGPEHTFDTEQVWTVIRGRAQAVTGEAAEILLAGDTAVFPAGQPRQVVCVGAEPFEAIVACAAGARASTPADGDRGTPPWIV
jgi:quercetin dioxygenase-like cupin family protein